MEHELEALSGAAVVNAQDIEELQCRQTDIERELAHLRDCVRTAFDHAGVDFERVAGFVTSRVPTLQVPVAESTTPTSINPHLRPSASGIIGVPGNNGGDGASRG
jgi:hypothetical protein